jgi:hypothetical protein
LQATANANVFLRDTLSYTSNLSKVICNTEANTQAEKDIMRNTSRDRASRNIYLVTFRKKDKL